MSYSNFFILELVVRVQQRVTLRVLESSTVFCISSVVVQVMALRWFEVLLVVQTVAVGWFMVWLVRSVYLLVSGKIFHTSTGVSSRNSTCTTWHWFSLSLLLIIDATPVTTIATADYDSNLNQNAENCSNYSTCIRTTTIIIVV